MQRGRDPLLLVAAAAVLLVTVVGTLEAAAWIGRPFPGFLVLGNQVVASAGLSRWPATRGGEIYQHEVAAADGIPVADAASLRSLVVARPAGAPILYRFRSGQHSFEQRIETRGFLPSDFVLLFGPYLFCGLGLAGMALAIRFLRRKDHAAAGSALCMWIVGMYALTALDLYGPHRLFRLHVLLECLLFAGTSHMALVFPHPRRFIVRAPRLIGLPYLAAVPLVLGGQLGLHDPASYVIVHRIAVSAFGGSLLALIGSQVWAYMRPPTFRARQRVKVLMLGTIGALAPQVVLAFASATTGGQAPENAMGWSGVLFPVAVGYAVLSHDLLEVDSILRSSVKYVLMTFVVALVYAGAVAGFEAVFRGESGWARGAFTVLFAAVAVNVLLPLRDRLQSLVDRLFFRSAYDFRRHVELTSARLALVAELRVIADEIGSAVREALHPEWMTLFIRRGPERPLEAILRRGEGAPEHAEPFEDRALERVAGDETLCVPFRAEGALIGLLVLGRRLSGRYYSREDRTLLLTLAHQGAVAIENALALEGLRDLNESLEAKVTERTGELARALHELRDTQAQLVHREKMASLGQFVAGIAHEMNNPMTFIKTNLYFLKQYADVLVDVLAAYEAKVQDPGLRSNLEALRRERDVDTILQDFGEVYDGCAEGVERTTGLLEDLRTFSRLDLPNYTEVDLHQALGSTLNLLSGRLAGIEIVQKYGELPLVECLAGQINQVVMNLLGNAADAVGGRGTITIRTSTLGEDRVVLEVEDNGSGMEPDVLEHIFDPFYTTKDVGKGTGLGLAITYGVVERHGGSIQVHSEPGRGSRFRVELPIHAPERSEGPTWGESAQ